MDENLRKLRQRLLDICAQCGVMVEETALECDCDLREYVVDSIQFISTIVEIENQLDIELTDEMLQFDSLASFYAFSINIFEILSNNLIEKDNCLFYKN